MRLKEDAFAEEDNDDMKRPNWTCWPSRLPVRVVPAVMLFLATFAHYFARVNVNIAVISMTDDPAGLCKGNNSGTDKLIDPTSGRVSFCWTEEQKSLVKGAFYYGYMVLQVPGGRLAESLGSRSVLGLATLVSSLFTLLTPWAALSSLEALAAVRIVIGLAQGVLFPCINPVVARWSRHDEQGRFAALGSMGGTLGTVFIYPLCGFMLDRWPWQRVFYVSGAVGLVWCAAWFRLVTDEPEDHPWISRRELDLILKNRQPRKRTPPAAGVGGWRDLVLLLWRLVTCPAVVVLMLCSFANDWGLYMILTEGPNFIGNVLGKDIATVGLLSSSPYVGRFLCAQVSAHLADKAIARETLSKINVRRLCFVVAYGSPALGLLLMGHLEADSWRACIAVMTVCFSLNGFNVPALLNILDVAPSYSGTVTGLTNGFSAAAGFLVPAVVAASVAGDPSDAAGWRVAFTTGTLLYSVALVGFFVSGSSEPGSFEEPRREDCLKLRAEEEEEEEEEENLL